MSLDLTKLIGIKHLSGKTTAQCPQCALEGHDRSKDHLVVFPNGAYACRVVPAHSKAIFALVGVGGNGVSSDSIPTEQPEPKVEVDRTWPADCLDRLVKDHSYWNRRGIPDEVMEPFRGGVATEGQLAGRYVLPIFNDSGEIIGFNGRIIDDSKITRVVRKWKLIGSSSKFVWGNLDEIESTRRVILVESMGDAFALMKHGVHDILCLFGATMSQVVLGRIISLNPDHIVVSTNQDENHSVGQNAALKIAKSLRVFFAEDAVQIILPQTGKDWGVATSEEIRQAFLGEAPEISLTDESSPVE